MLKINIVLPGFSVKEKVNGGYKVIYQYSNYLSENGFDICIYYNLMNGVNQKGFPNWLTRIVKKALFFIKKKNFPSWFKLNKKIIQKLCNINNKNIRNADIIIATAYVTTDDVKKLNKSKGKKVYFIQDFENWNGVSDEEVYNSYKLGFTNIVVSKWLKNIVDKNSNAKSVLISNGIDEKIFKITNKIEDRNNHSIAYLYHNDVRKGCKYGKQILEKLYQKYPDLHVELFGYPPRPKNLPLYIHYTQNANEKEVAKIMNESAIYMCTSLEEGFGLPGLEAMFCGCALVSTETQGVYEYANDDCAMLSNIDKMYDNICYLFEKNDKRINMAWLGNKNVQKNKLSISQDKFKDAMQNL